MTEQKSKCPKCNDSKYVRGFEMGVEGSHPCDCVTVSIFSPHYPIKDKMAAIMHYAVNDILMAVR